MEALVLALMYRIFNLKTDYLGAIEQQFSDKSFSVIFSSMIDSQSSSAYQR